jgi:bacteriorhodopsin
LRSWTPRRPSASIKRRLFPEAAAAALERELPDPINWRWLAPAMALCIAALIVLANNREPSAYRHTPTLALSNLDFATYFAAAQNDRNILQTTFEWTNGGHSMTTPPSFFDRNRYRE